MMHFMDVFVQKLCVQQPMNVIKRNVVCYVVGDKLADKSSETRNSPTIVWHSITHVILNDINDGPEKNWENHVNIQ